MEKAKSVSRSGFLRFFISFAAVAACCCVSCLPSSFEVFLPAGDIAPPSIVEARQNRAGAFEILFDEAVSPVEKSFGFEPSPTVPRPRAEGALLVVALEPAARPGELCSLSGEAKDLAGNTTRFLFSFAGYNENPAGLRLNELQLGKNSSASNAHRDYIEFLVEKKGNLGGLYVQWASSIKRMSYTFPPCDVEKGEVIVVHCAPEGNCGEADETGSNIALSGGVDASAHGRDFWTEAGGLPDETGLVLLRQREGDPPVDGIFFASLTKEGPLDAPKIAGLLEDLSLAGIWPALAPPEWKDAFLWKSSNARPLHRRTEGQGDAKGQWYVGETASQSPGLARPGAAASAATPAKKTRKKTAKGG